MAPLSLEIMRNSLLDIEELFYQMMKSGHEEDVLVKTNTAIYLAKLAFEESLKVSSIYEELYADLANHVDTLILKYRNVYSAMRNWFDNMSVDQQFHRSIVLREFGNLRGHLELLDSRLKTIHVWTDTPRSRFYKKYNCWVDANGFRVRDPKFAVNANGHYAVFEKKCPGAPEKSFDEKPEYNSVEPVKLTYENEEEDQEIEYPTMRERLRTHRICELEKSLSLAQAEQPSAKAEQPSAKAEQPSAKAEQPSAKAEQPLAKAEQPLAKAEQPSAKAEPLDYTKFNDSPEYLEFKKTLLTIFGELNRVNDDASYGSKTFKLIDQCKVVSKTFKYLLENKTFLENNKSFFENKKGKLNFLDATIDRCAALSRQIEERYDEIRKLVQRVDPSLRRIKNETVELLRLSAVEIGQIC